MAGTQKSDGNNDLIWIWDWWDSLRSWSGWVGVSNVGEFLVAHFQSVFSSSYNKANITETQCELRRLIFSIIYTVAPSEHDVKCTYTIFVYCLVFPICLTPSVWHNQSGLLQFKLNLCSLWSDSKVCYHFYFRATTNHLIIPNCLLFQWKWNFLKITSKNSRKIKIIVAIK